MTCAGPYHQGHPPNGLFKLGVILGRIGRMHRAQKITLEEMRQSGPTRLIVYCADYKCVHSIMVDASRWGDGVRLSDLEPRFTCQVCGHRDANIRPLFERARTGTGRH
jgi:hypothetical protein